MLTIDEQIKDIEEEIRKTPYHKGTEHHIGKLRARISRLKDKLIEGSTKAGGGGGGGYSVKKQGDATMVLIGPPSAGKSTLINLLTNAQSKVAPYAFTTVSVIPGMMEYRDARIQILDVPGLIEGAEEGKGRGREVLSVARGADLLVLMTDPKRIDAYKRIEEALYRNGIRANTEKPKVLVDKKLAGGVEVHSNLKQEYSSATVKEIANEMGIKNADITLNEKLTVDRLIDGFSKNRVYVPVIKVLNKIDTAKDAYKDNDFIKISAENNIGIEEFKEHVFKSLNFLVVFLIKPGEENNNGNSIVMKKGDSIKDVQLKIGTNFADIKKKAKIWGPGSKFPGQEVSLSTHLVEGMQIQFV